MSINKLHGEISNTVADLIKKQCVTRDLSVLLHMKIYLNRCEINIRQSQWNKITFLSKIFIFLQERELQKSYILTRKG